MLWYYCLKCSKNKESKNQSTKNGSIILLSTCAVCDSKKLKLKSKKLVDY